MILEPMRRGRSRVIWRYTPEASYRYSDGGPWCKTAEINYSNKTSLDAPLAQAIASALDRWGALEQRLYPDPMKQTSRFVCGEPGSAFLTLWPLVFQCLSCRTVHYYKNLENLRASNPTLRCRECQALGRLRQIPYVFVCVCGRIETPFVPKCKSEPKHSVELVDRKAFRESFWRCKACNSNLSPGKNTGLGFRLCQCGKAMRGLRLDDPQCYYAQTLNIVSIESKALDLWRSNPRFDLFLAGAALELPSHERSHINDLASPGDSGDGGTRVMETAIRMTLAKRGLSKAEIDQTLGEIVAASGGDTWNAYEKDIARFEDTYLACSFSGSRQAIEYVFVRDDRSCAPLALEELSQYAFDNGDQQSYVRYQREIALSRELGVRRMELIQELPLTLAAYGYTRFLSDPQATTKDAKSQESRATLRSFDPVDDKIPIYTARNTTEAFFFELDPAVVAAFVCLNAHMPLPNIARNDVPAWKAWILHNCSQLLTIGEAHFILTEWERVRGRQIDIAPALAFGALHSLAHAFKNTAHEICRYRW